MVSISTATWIAKNQHKDGVQDLPWDSGEEWMMRDYDDVDLSLLKQMRSRGMIQQVPSNVRNVNTWVIKDDVRRYYISKYE